MEGRRRGRAAVQWLRDPPSRATAHGPALLSHTGGAGRESASSLASSLARWTVLDTAASPGLTRAAQTAALLMVRWPKTVAAAVGAPGAVGRLARPCERAVDCELLGPCWLRRPAHSTAVRPGGRSWRSSPWSVSQQRALGLTRQDSRSSSFLAAADHGERKRRRRLARRRCSAACSQALSRSRATLSRTRCGARPPAWSKADALHGRAASLPTGGDGRD